MTMLHSGLATDFAARWQTLAARLGLSPAVAASTGAVLLGCYTESTRHYHGVAHILSMLKGFDAIRVDFGHAPAAELAIFFHDLIYDAYRSDNEERSATEMRSLLGGHLAEEILDRAAFAILATQRHVMTPDPDANRISDLDMAILGQPWPVYERYAAGVMREYVPVYGEAAYRQGRVARFIEPVLEHGEIFLTAGFKSLTAQAMSNLRQERVWLLSPSA
ncbi:MAG: hypothetical protein JWO82_3059 [Akkermansiaceae bacterium]|nr:hypothetical protein [Akkermansiaceae bacterium]